jgi:hypothetical protein
VKKKAGNFFFFLLFSLVLFLPYSFPAKKRGPIILGIGAGYSFFLDSGLKSYEVYHPRLIYFSEQLSMKNNFHFHVQYFPWYGFGFQLGFTNQKGGYNSDLKWYGYRIPQGKIIEINHIEEPYRETWSLSSITASIMYVLTLKQNKKIRPFVSAGIGHYFSSGDDERFYYRTRLGPGKSGNMIKLGLGFKYQISPKINVNLRGVGGTIWRKEHGFSGILYVGPDQFDYLTYVETGKIVRHENLYVNSITYLGIALSLEFIL